MLDTLSLKRVANQHPSDRAWRFELFVNGDSILSLLERYCPSSNGHVGMQSAFHNHNDLHRLLAPSPPSPSPIHSVCLLECSCGDQDCGSIWLQIHSQNGFLTWTELIDYRDLCKRKADRSIDFSNVPQFCFSYTEVADSIECISMPGGEAV